MLTPLLRLLKVVCAFAVTILATTPPALADLLSGYVLRSVVYPGDRNTSPTDINNAGQILGNSGYNNAHGFLLNPDGTFVDIVHPGQPTAIFHGLNDLGQIVGYSSSDPFGFLRNSDGTITDLNYPSAQVTTPYGINNVGQTVGFFQDQDGACHGFIYSSTSIAAFDHSLGLENCTTGADINDSGDIVGYVGFSDGTGGNGIIQGFLRKPDGQFLPIIPPGATSYSVALDINNKGQIVGSYLDGTIFRGFLYNNGVFTDMTYPGAWMTQIVGINDRGEIVGIYQSGATGFHGFYGTTVPEPTSLLLMVFAFVLIVVRRCYGN